MRFLCSRPADPREQLALEEVLLEQLDASGDKEDEALLIWEPEALCVVLGFANRVAEEANAAACRAAGVPILRRVSGGGTVLHGPGSLNFSLILRIEPGGPMDSVSGANTFILGRIRDALDPLAEGDIEIRGQTDLAIRDRKFSGNAQKRKRRALLFHGTLLLDFDLAQIERFLRMPPRQPDYRAGRSHADFVRNLELSTDGVIEALQEAWESRESLSPPPSSDIDHLVREKYASDEWNLRR